MSLPLPVRLTLFYALLLGVALWGFGSLVYQQAEQRAYDDLDKLLSNRAASVQLGKDLIFSTNASNPPPVRQLPGVNALGGEGVAIKVFDDKLTLLASTNTDAAPGLDTTVLGLNSDRLPWDGPAARKLLAEFQKTGRSPEGIYSTILYEDRAVLVYTTINPDFNAGHIIQTASSEQSLQQSLANLRSTLLAGGVLVVLLALGGGLCLTWGTLAAVRRVTNTARTISASRDFRQRVRLKSTLGRDEITTLATTFNGMLANLERAYQQQKRFIADASHELRAPITSISCNLDLLVRAPDLPCTEREATLLDARSEAERMGRLVNDLLTLARADEIADTREEPRATSLQTSAATLPRVDLDSLVLNVFRQYRSTNEQHDEASTPRLVLQHITPAQVYGDTDQLKQALVALLDNALKYTPAAGSVTLSLSIAGHEATLTVSDTGIGIDPEDLPHIFERFYRADRARSREQGGSGLGLAIVQSIVQEHRGRIDVESILGKGSAFSIRLPIIESTF